MNAKKAFSLLLVLLFGTFIFYACTGINMNEALNNQTANNGEITNEPDEGSKTDMPETMVPETEVPPTEVPTTEEPVTHVQASEAPSGAEPMTLGGGHTATFTFTDTTIYADFELPEGYELRTEKGDETRVPLNVSNIEGGYIYNANGELVGAFTVSPYDAEAPEDNLDRIYAEFLLGHWHIMLEEMYDPIAVHGTVHPALTLAEAVEVIEGQSMAANERFICDAVIAYDTGCHAIIELAFDQGVLTRDQLTTIAESIVLSDD